MCNHLFNSYIMSKILLDDKYEQKEKKRKEKGKIKENK
jgi:hypothetical protein